ncbi:MAG: hypothetical protein U9N36_07015 [Euryarchaeota archaeon]|nr:hypothetical protein [Euryarchaeota archaeon]
MKRITFGIGIVLAVLAVLTAQAAADPWDGYLIPQDGTGICGGDDKFVEFWVNYEGWGTGCSGYQVDIYFDPSCINITDADFSESPFSWNGFGTRELYDPPNHIRIAGEQEAVIAPGLYKMATLTAHCECESGSCVSELGFAKNITVDPDGDDVTNSYTNGTFTFTGSSEIFTKSLDLGWNLISLPLTPSDSSTSAVLGNGDCTIVYGEVYSYDASTNQFVAVTTGTMETGVGYFADVTTAGTWSYEGYAVDSMSTPLSPSLNCIGWTNTSADLPGAIDSIAGDYRYVSRWNAAEQKYELYDPVGETEGPEFIDFTTMERGVGYFVAATDSCTLTYP